MPTRDSLIANLPATRFRGLTRLQALGVLLVTGVTMGGLVVVANNYDAPASASDLGREGDLAVYGRIVAAMRDGTGYYEAAHTALKAGGYGTLSVFNWRLPTLSFAQSLVSASLWSAIAGAMTVVAIALFSAAIGRRAGFATAALTAIALSVSLATFATPAGGQFTETVAGMLIVASIGAFGLRMKLVGVGLAIAALFVRELAALYVVIGIWLAWQDGDRRALAAWGLGLAAFAVFFAWHSASVQAQLGPDDFAYRDSWIQFGGLSFVLATAAFNGLFIGEPLWVTAIVLPTSLLGLLAWRDAALAPRVVLTVAACMAAFAVVGKPFNDYWGALYTPLLTVGLAFLPATLGDLLGALAKPRR